MYSLILICTNRFKWVAHLGGSRSSDLFTSTWNGTYRLFLWMICFVDCKMSVDNELDFNDETNRLDAQTRTPQTHASVYCRVHRLRSLLILFLLFLFEFIVMRVLPVIKGKRTECVCTICTLDLRKRSTVAEWARATRKTYAFSACSVCYFDSAEKPSRSSSARYLGESFFFFCFSRINFYDLCASMGAWLRLQTCTFGKNIPIDFDITVKKWKPLRKKRKK